MKKNMSTACSGMTLCFVVILILGLTGLAFAHPDITLKDAAGNNIADVGSTTLAPAYSANQTCGACHDGTADHNPDGEVLLSYNQIEKHSFHAQEGANHLAEFNPLGMMPWAQSKGMFGKW